MRDMRSLVLVAVPDAVEAVMYEAVLQTHGFEVIAVVDGFEAADVVFERRPDVVVVDHSLEGLDGAALCALIKGRAATDAIPVVMLTSAAEGDARADLAHAAVDVVLRHPCPPELLAIEVKRLAPPLRPPRPRLSGTRRRTDDQRTPTGHSA